MNSFTNNISSIAPNNEANLADLFMDKLIQLTMSKDKSTNGANSGKYLESILELNKSLNKNDVTNLKHKYASIPLPLSNS